MIMYAHRTTGNWTVVMRTCPIVRSVCQWFHVWRDSQEVLTMYRAACMVRMGKSTRGCTVYESRLAGTSPCSASCARDCQSKAVDIDARSKDAFRTDEKNVLSS
jgi:hypothetical protein